ncbi:sensor histidine kinase [Frankia sp. CN7]|uniref:sensor histidine kinase n=1 Tax=Frankia nepalensis TaxID=1836974 RepID=UPI00193476D6|nr:GAF domain-containing sensor histidine kinase [Frankia nepalensis]MBL7499522.1 sensor histidine kinase [Frankia nepalensis]MBL7511720.1 sensor histidine kinase [Frankia nepalensis]
MTYLPGPAGPVPSAPAGPDRPDAAPEPGAGPAAADAAAAAAPARWAESLAVSLPCLAAVVAAVWLDVTAPAEGPGATVAEGSGWPFAAYGAVIGLLASTVLIGARGRTLGWLLASLGLVWALDGLTQTYIHAGLRADGSWPAMTFALWFLYRFGAFLPVLMGALLLVFPTGRFLPGRAGTLGRVTLGALVVTGVAFLVAPADESLLPSAVPAGIDVDPTSIGALSGHGEQIRTGASALGVTAFLCALALVVVRYRRSTGLMRDRMRWLLWSVVVIAVTLPLLYTVEPAVFDYLVSFVVLVLPAAAVTVALVRPALVPIGDLLARTVVTAAVLVTLVAADAAVLAVLATLVDDLTSARIVAVVLVVTVVLYGPARLRLSAAVRRWMLGGRGNPYDALAGLASTLENTDDVGEQLAAVARAVAAAFGARFVSLEVDWAHGSRMVTTHGAWPDRVRILPITYRGASVGRLVMPARGLRGHLSARDEQLLGDLVRQAATAARTSQLAEEVQRSRERLVNAREEERRRIRRDLHDGLGPALASVVHQVEAARLTVDRDPAKVKARLDGVGRHVQSIVADVRRLVHDLRPPALDDRGLAGALRQQATRLGLPLTVDAADLAGRLPAAVEVAAYRIAGEALTNVARHARAGAARLALTLADGALLVEVTDDGVGIDPDRQSGVGLVSLRERAAELGGRVEITCPPGGGTVVRAWLPVRSAP